MSNFSNSFSSKLNLKQSDRQQMLVYIDFIKRRTFAFNWSSQIIRPSTLISDEKTDTAIQIISPFDLSIDPPL